MKPSLHKTILPLLAAAALLGACSPKPRQRQPHEGPRSWAVVEQKTQVQMSTLKSAFSSLNLEKMEEALGGPAEHLESAVLEPLSRFVLDPGFVFAAANMTKRLETAVRIFNEALWITLNKNKALGFEARRQWLSRYEGAVMAGCSADLKRGCLSLTAGYSLFSGEARTSRLIHALAIQDDAQIDAQLKNHATAKNCILQSETCRRLIDLRYRRLAMAFAVKKSKAFDQDLNFSFMKYIRLLDHLIVSGHDIGYLGKTYQSIFEIAIQRYTPKNVDDPELRRFVENFSPWSYNSQGAESFRHGSKALLDLATRCCLYRQDGRFGLSASMSEAIRESQIDENTGRLSFYQIVKALESAGKSREILSALGMNKELAGLNDLNSDFYDEYFYLLDRLFNEQLESGDAMRILERMDWTRTSGRLLSTLRVYMKVRVAYLAADTLDFMNRFYSSKSIASNAIFAEVITQSREVSTKWMKVQSQLDLLEKFVSSYFKRRALLSSEYIRTTDMMKSVNRNIHYLSVYPNMLGMTYFLAKNQGTIKERSWWGAEFVIQPETVVADLLDGKYKAQDPWLKFTADAVKLSRERLFYAFHYALKTKALEAFTVEEKTKGQSDRSKFFEIILGKYLQAEKRNLEDLYMEFDRKVLGVSAFPQLENICRYELAPAGQSLPPVPVEVNLLELGSYTYAGLGENRYSGLIKAALTGKTASGIQSIYADIEPKLVFVRAIIALIEDHMIAAGEIKAKGETHPELDNIRRILSDVESRKDRLINLYGKYRARLFTCSLQLYRVELMRAYRLIHEEREHLGRVHDFLKSVREKSTSDAQKAALQELNDRNFSSSRFDRLRADGYNMSQYDFLMRLKSRVEADIFTRVTDREREVFGEELRTLVKPRVVHVKVPAGLERMDVVVQSPSQVIVYQDDKEQFIRSGLKHFSGANHASFAEWYAQANHLGAYRDYLNTLVTLYLSGETVSGPELVDVFKEIVKVTHLNDFDVENARIMGLEGRMSVESLQGFLIEPVSLRAQPLLRSLMKQMYVQAGFDEGFKGLLASGRDLFNTLTTEGVIIFDPGAGFQRTLSEVYSRPIQRITGKTLDFFTYVSRLENDPELQALFNVRLRIDEDRQVVDLIGSKRDGRLTVVDELMMGNLAASHNSFTNKTENFFGTQLLKQSGRNGFERLELKSDGE